MSKLLHNLLGIIKVAVISGGDWPQFEKQLLSNLPVDVTKPGIDKAYGIEKLRDTLGISIQEMIFIGDALFPGGNDYPAKEAGVVSIPVKNPNESKRVIETIIACLDGVYDPPVYKEENK